MPKAEQELRQGENNVRRGMRRAVGACLSCHISGPIRVSALFSALFAAASLAGTAPTAAQFQVCNQTFDVLNLAVAQEIDGAYQSEGWWTIGANRCVDVIKDELVNRYIYVFATDVFDQPILDGTVEICVGPKRFVITGLESCWQRGHKVARFMEVDTQAVERWTLFLKDPLSN